MTLTYKPSVDKQAARLAYTDLMRWKEKYDSGKEVDLVDGQDALARLYTHANINTLTLALPFLLRLRGQPFTLDDHFPMEPLYERINIPPSILLKCGRQVSKSTSLGALGVIRSATIPYFNQLFVTPLCEQVQRFSNNIVAPFIKHSPVRTMLTGEGLADTDNKGRMNVFQRTFSNDSNMFFSFAFLDVDRIRGISADSLSIDEVQDMEWSFIPIIQECITASKMGKLKLYSGTPKTSDNTIHRLWEDSSQATWTIKCTACNHLNICNLEHGLDRMVQPKGFCCSKCERLIDPRTGRFWHAYPDRRNQFPGYHTPQPIMPMHYADENAWADLYRKKIKYPRAKYLNECLGETCDVGTKLVNIEKLKECSILPWNSNVDNAIQARLKSGYEHVMMGIDWGGGGAGRVRRIRGKIAVEDGTPSFTFVTIVGFSATTPNPDVIYAERLPAGMTPEEEVSRIKWLFTKFQCNMIGHDYGGAGNLRETMLIQAGFPTERILPFVYTSQPTKPVVVYNPPAFASPRKYYSFDKTRSLRIICAAINGNIIRFPNDWENTKEYMEEFLNLIEDSTERPGGASLYRIMADPSKPCDFPHSLNYACFAQWYVKEMYPDLAEAFGVKEDYMELYDVHDLPSEGW